MRTILARARGATHITHAQARADSDHCPTGQFPDERNPPLANEERARREPVTPGRSLSKPDSENRSVTASRPQPTHSTEGLTSASGASPGLRKCRLENWCFPSCRRTSANVKQVPCRLKRAASRGSPRMQAATDLSPRAHRDRRILADRSPSIRAHLAAALTRDKLSRNDPADPSRLERGPTRMNTDRLHPRRSVARY